MLKKSLCVIVVFCFVILTLCPVFAAEATMTDSEFEAAAAEIIKDYYDNPSAARVELAEIGAFLDGEPVAVCHSANGNARGTNPSDYTLYVTSMRRTGSDIRYLMWNLQANANEWFEGPLDYVSLEWDTAYAEYYASNGDDVMVTVAGREEGIVVFNLEDDKLGNGDTCYGTVRVRPIRNGEMEYGSKFVHTYTSLLVSGAASWSFSPSAELASNGVASLGLSYTMGFSVNVSSQTNQWNIWADNAVSFS